MSPRGLSLLVLVALLAAFAGWALRSSGAEADAADPAASASATPVRPAAGLPDPGATRVTVPTEVEPLVASAGSSDEGAASASLTEVVMTVRVLAADGDAPLADVRLQLLRDGRATPLGVTDAQGAAVVRVPPQGPVVVAAHGAGLREAQGSYRHAPPPEMVLRMDSGTALYGQVVQHRGGVAAGVRVIAIPQGHGVGDHEIRACVRGADSRVPSAVTDAAGNFRIEGLMPGARYWLRFGGSGLLGSGHDRNSAIPEDSPVTLNAYPVHAGIVRLRGPGGERLDAPPDSLRLGWAVEAETLAAKALGATDDIDVLLCGIEAGASIADADFDRVALGAWIEAPPADLSTAFHIDLVGFERTVAMVPLAPVAEPLPVTEVRLQPWVTPLGTIRLHFLDPPPPFDGESPVRGLGDCIVFQAEPRWHRYYSVQDLSRPTELAGIPVGEAGCSFYFLERFVSDELFYQRTLVGTDAVVVEYDLSEFASVSFVAARPDGGVHMGSLRVELTWLAKNRSEELTFARPPYQSRPLPAGTYQVRLLAPLGPTRELPPPFEVEVPAGRCTVIDLPRPPD